MRALGAAVGIVVLLVCSLGCGEDATSCEVHADCVSSRESSEAGRCGPEAACVSGKCAAWCPQDCTATEQTVNTCDEGYVCTVHSRCRATEIECEQADECPSYRPGDGEWTCESGTCRFPGFAYLYENP